MRTCNCAKGVTVNGAVVRRVSVRVSRKPGLSVAASVFFWGGCDGGFQVAGDDAAVFCVLGLVLGAVRVGHCVVDLTQFGCVFCNGVDVVATARDLAGAAVSCVTGFDVAV